MKKFFGLILFIFLFSVQNIFAQQSISTSAYDVNMMTPSMRAIATGKGRITKTEYDKFWSDFGMSTSDQKSDVITVMRKNFLAVQDYQKELWKCVKQAWLSQVVPTCDNAKLKYAVVQKNMEEMKQEEMLKSMEVEADDLLNSAAKRGKIRTNNGSEVQLTPQLIDDTSKTFSEVFSRFDQVLRVNY